MFYGVFRRNTPGNRNYRMKLKNMRSNGEITGAEGRYIARKGGGYVPDNGVDLIPCVQA